MNISELIRFRNSLQENLDMFRMHEPINATCNLLEILVSQHAEVEGYIGYKIIDFQNKFKTMIPQAQQIMIDFENYIGELNHMIDSEAERKYDETFKTSWRESFINGNDQNFYVTKAVDYRVRASIQQYVDWHYPALQLGCRYNGQLPTSADYEQGDFVEFTDSITGFEPLYICDFNAESIAKCVSRYNPTYQNKICKYVINENDFSRLPQEQFGFVFCWNMFNYSTLSVLTEYLQSIFSLLRTGGTLMFSYNNCDLPSSALCVDLWSGSYIPKRHLIPICEQLGFEIIDSYDFPNEVGNFEFSQISWIEIKKPGMLSSAKAHPPLGEIVD